MLQNKLQLSMPFQGKYSRDQGNGVRGLRGHIRCKERVRPPLRIQRLQPVPGRPLLPVHEGIQTSRCGEEAGGAGQDEDKIQHQLG